MYVYEIMTPINILKDASDMKEKYIKSIVKVGECNYRKWQWAGKNFNVELIRTHKVRSCVPVNEFEISIWEEILTPK